MEHRISKRQVRKKYKTVNGFTSSPSFAQIISLLLMTTIIILQAILIKSIIEIGSVILNTVFAFSYVFLIFIAYDYVLLMKIDPVDLRLLDQPFEQRAYNRKLLIWCATCKMDVHRYSYHCKTCNRCVDQFDHHCIYVNNCIGRQNYKFFFRIVMSLIFFMLIQMAQAIWILVMDASNVRFLALILLVLTGSILLLLVYNAAYHFYQVFFEYGTTLRYLRGANPFEDTKSEQRMAKNAFVKGLIQSGKQNALKGRQIEIDYEVIGSASHLKKDFYLF